MGTTPANIDSRASVMALAFGVSKVDMLSPVRLVRSFDHCLTLFSEVTLGSGAALTAG